jgi:hypothetical protein
MPVATPIQEELKQIQRQLLDEQSDDPVLRLFAKRRLPEGARLRRLYAAQIKAEADLKRINEKIDAAGQELERLRATHLAQWDQPTIDTDMPSDADALAYATAKDKASLIRGLLEAWQMQVRSYQLHLNDRGKEFDAAFQTYRNLLWRLTGSSDVQPAWVVIDRHGDDRGWHQPEGYELGTLEATAQQLEA